MAMDVFEEALRGALAEGRTDKEVVKAFKYEWSESLRERMVLLVLRQAQAFLKADGYQSEAKSENGTEVYFRWADHVLKFDFDSESGKIVCTSSIDRLNEEYDIPRESKGFSPFCVESKVVAFVRAVASLV